MSLLPHVTWKEHGKASISMCDYKQRLADWHQYKEEHKIEFMMKRVVLGGGLYLKSRSWFLLQSVEKRKALEELQERELREIFENARMAQKRKQDEK